MGGLSGQHAGAEGHSVSSIQVMPQWKLNDLACAACADSIRASSEIKSLFLRQTQPPWSFDNFSAAIASYHLVAELPKDEDVRAMNAEFLKELGSFRAALTKYQRAAGEIFPTLHQSLEMFEGRERRHRNFSPEVQRPSHETSQFVFSKSVRLEDLLDEIEDSILGGDVSPETHRDHRICTPTGRIAKKGRSRAILLVVNELLRHQIKPSGDFVALAKACVKELIGKVVEEREIRARLPEIG